MPTATLRIVGGSVVNAIPKKLLELGHLQSGSQVSIDVQQGQLILKAKKAKRYTLAELAAQCDPSLAITPEKQQWLDAPAVGLEIDETAHQCARPPLAKFG